VGVAVVPVTFLYAWRAKKLSLAKSTLAAIVSCWGLVLYMVYQWIKFGTPLAFAKTQTDWMGRHFLPWRELPWALISAAPIRKVFDPGSDSYWGLYEPSDWPIFNVHFVNPIFFLTALCLIGFGAIAKKLDIYELVFSLGLLAIPYVAHSYISGMISHARFTCVVFPVYLVLGAALARLPIVVASPLAACGAALVALYAAMFAMWHRMF
jgi:hypothetical protein